LISTISIAFVMVLQRRMSDSILKISESTLDGFRKGPRNS